MSTARDGLVEPEREVLWSRERGRFQVFDGGEVYHCRDWLRRGERALIKAGSASWGSEPLMREFLRQAFGQGCVTTSPHQVATRPRDPEDLLFWQFPCRTEAAAFELHAGDGLPAVQGGTLHCYLGLPWATWIDKERTDARQPEAHRQVERIGLRLGGLRRALRSVGSELRVHTVCQHIWWPRMVRSARSAGVTDLWLSHAPPADRIAAEPELRLHPWHLYAVNVLDAERRAGIIIGKDPSERPILASFVGVHLPHYITDARLRLRGLATEPGFVVEVTEDKWHFEDVVYRHQVHHAPLQSSYRIGESVARYNSLLSDSIFALCPAGAGPNTLRLWEALAVGAIPVLIGPSPRLPEGGTLPAIDWDRIVVHVDDERIPELPHRLRRMPLAERRQRQSLGLQAFAAVRQQRCF